MITAPRMIDGSYTDVYCDLGTDRGDYTGIATSDTSTANFQCFEDTDPDRKDNEHRNRAERRKKKKIRCKRKDTMNYKHNRKVLELKKWYRDMMKPSGHIRKEVILSGMSYKENINNV